MGNGPLAEPAMPDIPGIESFAGTAFHTARWRADHDLRGERVAVIGTGASAIQVVPEIQPLVEHLTVFQRTPPWVLPHTNRRITDVERAVYRRVPAAAAAGAGWDLLVARAVRHGDAAQRQGARAAREARPSPPRQAGAAIPQLRARLTPDYRPGCKRLLLSNDYYPALQQPNVDVVTEKVIEVRPHSVVTADGVEHAVDTIIYGTGFHVTDNPVAERVQGVDGRTLADHWTEHGAQAYLGTTVPAFPNLFLLAGPNTGIGHTSLVVMIEAQLQYVVDALRTMDARGAASVELRRPVLAAWTDEIQRKASRTVWNTGGCASWYLDAEGRNTTLWPDHTYKFAARHAPVRRGELRARRHGATRRSPPDGRTHHDRGRNRARHRCRQRHRPCDGAGARGAGRVGAVRRHRRRRGGEGRRRVRGARRAGDGVVRGRRRRPWRPWTRWPRRCTRTTARSACSSTTLASA